MRKNLFIVLLGLFPLMAMAKEDPIIMHINGQAVYRSEFEQDYRRICAEGTTSLNLAEYTTVFVNRRLKIEEAKRMGLDTVAAYREQFDQFRREWVKDYLAKQLGHEYSAMKKEKATEEWVEVLQITKHLSQNITSTRLRSDARLIDSLYTALLEHPNQSFEKLVSQFSDEKNKMWVKPLYFTKEIEEVAFSLKPGKFSEPFFSPEGYHILKVISRRQVEIPDLSVDVNTSEGVDRLVDDLKTKYHYAPNKDGIDELLRNGETNKTLFTFGGQTFGGALFKQFPIAKELGVKAALNAFITQHILDYEGQLLTQGEEFRNAVEPYSSEWLIGELTRRKVDIPAFSDHKALEMYFEHHQSNYKFDQSKFKGVVVHCTDKKIAKKVKKVVKKYPQEEWAMLINKTFNSEGKEQVKVQEGFFSKGDNPYVDKMVYKAGRFEPLKSHPFTVVLGEKKKMPDSYMEVADLVQKDYKTFLNTYWMGRLRAEYKVEINQEVLKTVNNL